MDASPSLDQVQYPQLLVGQRTRHRFAENDGELVWYQGQVIRMNSRTLKFYVLYDGEQDVCCFKLLEDIANGDLFIDPFMFSASALIVTCTCTNST